MKKIMLTGARPTGKLHLGHYVGALKSLVEMQYDYNTFYLISDIHMLTTKSDKKYIDLMYQNTIDMVTDCIGIGMDPKNTTFYLQSNIPELNNIFCLIQNLVDIKRVESTPSLIEMSKHNEGEMVSLGLVAYPVLEAADIIGLGAQMVPVGKDNIDHIEVTKEILKKFNYKYNTQYQMPDYVTSKHNHLIGTDGQNKMSKSLKNSINIRDSSDDVFQKISKMKWTESNSKEINVVLEYMDAFCERNKYKKILKDYKNGKDVEKEAKEILYKTINDLIEPMRIRMKPYLENPKKVLNLLKRGIKKVRKIINKNYQKLRKEMGLTDLFN